MPKSTWDWTLERRLRFHLRRAIRHIPSVYLPISRVRRRPYMLFDGVPMVHTSVFGSGTELVIEGPYRCGNTFAVVAFQLAQGRLLNVAHHLHAEAQIIGAARAGVPAVLLLRAPEDVVVSTSVSFGIPLYQALKDYVTFYSRVLPYRDRLVVAPFEQVIGNFGGVVETVNATFGTDFRPFIHTQENVDRCFEIIDEFYRRTAPEPRRTVARPSEQRGSRKEEVRAEYGGARYADLRQSADDLYRTLRAQAERAGAAV
jgi:hypothetical protein